MLLPRIACCAPAFLHENWDASVNPPMINKPQKVGSQFKIFPLKNVEFLSATVGDVLLLFSRVSF